MVKMQQNKNYDYISMNRKAFDIVLCRQQLDNDTRTSTEYDVKTKWWIW